MNTLLKAILKEIDDLVQVGQAAVAKNYTSVLTALIGAGEDVPAIVTNWADMSVELAALAANPAADADLLAYALTLKSVAGLDAKAQAMIKDSASLLINLGTGVKQLVADLKA